MVQLGETLIQSLSNLLTLESSGCSEDDNFRHGLEDINPEALGSFLHRCKSRIGPDVILHLLHNLRYVNPEVLDAETDLDEFLLLHKHGIWNIVHYLLTENRCGEMRVGVFCGNLLMFCIENEIATFGTKRNGNSTPEKDESEYITVLLAAFEKELVRINTVVDRTADHGDKVEHDGREVLGFRQQKLASNVEDDCQEGDQDGKGEGLDSDRRVC